MKIDAILTNSGSDHKVVVSTNNNSKAISIPAKAEGNGSSVNGGELLFAALATCFCNDIYREATRRNIAINSIVVHVTLVSSGAKATQRKKYRTRQKLIHRIREMKLTS